MHWIVLIQMHDHFLVVVSGGTYTGGVFSSLTLLGASSLSHHISTLNAVYVLIGLRNHFPAHNSIFDHLGSGLLIVAFLQECLKTCALLSDH